MLDKSYHSKLEGHSLLKNFMSALKCMNAALLFMVKKCMCVCVSARAHACVHVHAHMHA